MNDKPRPACLCEVAPDRRGYYGLRLRMLLRDHHKPLPRWVWRVYWALQPVRCRLGFHDWYHTAAGMCCACTCGASSPYRRQITVEYRWRPWLKSWVARVEDAEFRAQFWQAEWERTLEERAA